MRTARRTLRSWRQPLVPLHIWSGLALALILSAPLPHLHLESVSAASTDASVSDDSAHQEHSVYQTTEALTCGICRSSDEHRAAFVQSEALPPVSVDRMAMPATALAGPNPRPVGATFSRGPPVFQPA